MGHQSVTEHHLVQQDLTIGAVQAHKADVH